MPITHLINQAYKFIVRGQNFVSLWFCDKQSMKKSDAINSFSLPVNFIKL